MNNRIGRVLIALALPLRADFGGGYLWKEVSTSLRVRPFSCKEGEII